MQIEPIAHIQTAYPVKFGVPRQPGLVDDLLAEVVMEPAFRNADAFRGIGGFSHLWLIWGFSVNADRPWTPTVRPPRLGGTERMGVWATRSSFRPNELGLSCVEFVELRQDAELGPVLVVRGADMVDGTPIYDIKPYVPYADSRPGATSGWVGTNTWEPLAVDDPDALLERLPERLRAGAVELLAQDPRPAYTRATQPDRLFWVPVEDNVIWFDVRPAADGGRVACAGERPDGTCAGERPDGAVPAGRDVLRVRDVVRLTAAEYERLRQTGTVDPMSV